jgi:type IV pilus assembly protein PilM
MARTKSSKTKSVVGLDIEAGSICATEVQANGSVEVVGGAVAQLPPAIFREGEVVDPEALGVAMRDLFTEHKLSRSVRLGIANQRVAVRSMKLPEIEDAQELETAIRFQAQDHIPMPLDQAVLDWQVVGRSQDASGNPCVDVVAVAARRDMLGNMMRAMSVAGLRPVGIDHAAFGMVRALAPEPGIPVGPAQYVSAPLGPQQGESEVGSGEIGAEGTDVGDAAVHVPTRLYCNLGDVTNLAVAHGRACLFTRISSFGIEGIAQKLAERRGLTLEHAREWLAHVGLQQPVDAIDGEREHVAAARDCLQDGVARLAEELRLSLDYYGAQDGARTVEEVAVCGPGTTIPGLVERLQHALGYPFRVARPAALAHLSDVAAARQTLSFGLALEE